MCKVSNFARKFFILDTLGIKLNESTIVTKGDSLNDEKEFTVIKPKRNAKNVRVYTIKDIETVKMIYYLVKEKGLKLDAAQAMIKRNRDGISKQFEVVERLKQVRGQLLLLDNALSAIKK